MRTSPRPSSLTKGVQVAASAFLFTCVAASAAAAQSKPASAKAASPVEDVLEVPVTIGEGKWAVPGILALPGKDGSFPVAVLMHGFGPGSIDGDVGPNKVMRETAIGLASRDVAALRFAKRTTVHSKLFASEHRRATIEEEWIDDSVAAVAILKATPKIDPHRVFIVGHSASAALAPQVASVAEAAGAVLVNGSARKPGALIKDQVEYTATLRENDTPEAKAGHTKLLAAAERLLADVGDDADVILGQPMWFWRAMAARDVVSDVRTFTTNGGHVLVVHGARDYLTTETDWLGLKNALSRFPNVQMRQFVNLNHMMQDGEGKMTPAEYQWKKPVSDEWISALADWIKSKS
ncbi:MAG: alpha/beta hydrolase family protein [Rhodospirillaceae bacterium]